jgi:hypothetical protein
MSWIDAVGFAAASAVLASFCMTTIVPLRLLAILSNILFGLYGVSAHLYPVFLLHSILLPINLLKLARGAARPERLAFLCALSALVGRFTLKRKSATL